MRFGITVIFIFISAFLNGQSDCNIQIANEVSDDIILRSGFHISQDSTSGEIWSIDNDDDILRLSLEPNASSAELIIENFNPDIPDGSMLIGIGVSIRGKSVGGIVTDEIIQYETDLGNSDNYSNRINFGFPWMENNHRWYYGSGTDHMNGPATIELLNAEAINLKVKIANIGEETANVELEDIALVLRIRKPYTICPDHLCMIFHLPNADVSSQFEWNVPTGFELLDEDQSSNIKGINVHPETPYGFYEVCVTETMLSGVQDQCCRTVYLSNCSPSSIGDAVFVDHNYNGIRDQEEPGIASIEMILYNDELDYIQSTFTDINGNYQFNDVTEGFYQVRVVYNGDLSPSFASSFSLNHGNFLSDIFFVQDSESIDTLDFGFNQLYQIDGQVWNDSNCNGLINSEEVSFENLTVGLYDLDGVLVDSDLIDNGIYQFADIQEGSYSLRLLDYDINLYTPTVINQDLSGNNLSLDEGIATTPEFYIQDNRVVNLGLKYWPSSISGSIFVDTNRNNLNNNDALYLETLVITLMNTETGITESVQATGTYLFEDIGPGSYILSTTIPEGFDSSLSNIGESNENFDLSDIGSETVATEVLMISPGTELSSIDVGFQLKIGSISGYLFEDVSANHFSEEEDFGIPNVELIATNTDGIDFSTTTDELGHYVFMDLPVGSYTVSINIDPDYILVDSNVGDDDSIDSDFLTMNDAILLSDIELSADQLVEHIDAGFYRYGTIKGLVWTDANGDGIRDLDEQLLDGITVRIQGGNISPVEVTTIDGYYEVRMLTPATYHVSHDRSEDFMFTIGLQGDDGTLDSNIELFSDTTGRTKNIFIESGNVVDHIDIGLIDIQMSLGSISGYVWEDLEMDGIRDGTDLFIPSYMVSLTSSTGEEFITMTDDNGFYMFDDLLPDVYFVSVTLSENDTFTIPNTGDNETIDSDIKNINGSFGTTGNLFVNVLTNLSSVDIGIVPGVNPENNSISGYVFDDVSGNSYSEEEDYGIAGITVTAVAFNGAVYTTMTDNDGLYIFTDLPDDTYNVLIEADTIYNLVDSNVGNDDSIDSDFVLTDTGSVIFEGLVLADDVVITNIDAGFYRFGTIRGFVWSDMNNDGIRDESEILLEGFEIYTDGDFESQRTISNGLGYRIDNLKPGTYLIAMDNNGNYSFSPAKQGSNPAVDSDLELFRTDRATTTNIFIESGTVHDNIDIGLVPITMTSSISGIVWNDLMNDGIRDESDTAVNGATVTLTGESTVLTTVTNENGVYHFENLQFGIYNVSYIINDSESLFSTPNVGTDDDLDSDIVNISGDRGTTANIFIFTTSDIANIDIGLVGTVTNVEPSTVSGYIYHDNFDGLSIGDGPIEGVELLLVDLGSGEIIAVTSSDVFGYYEFNISALGDYRVEIKLPTDFILTIPNIGTNDLVDSDFRDFGQEGILSEEFTINTDNQDFIFDAGFYQFGRIDGVVWFDENGDGLRNIDDGIIEPYTVHLYKGSQLYHTTEADENGYTFDNLVPSTYFVAIEIEGNLYSITLPLQGDEPTLDSDIVNIGDPLSTTGNIFLNSGETISSIDIGLVHMTINDVGSIGGRIWNDLNTNGIQDTPSELTPNGGISNISVFLFDMSDQVLEVVLTDDLGYYNFPNLSSGDYRIGVSVDVGTTFTIANQGSDDEDSDIILFAGVSGSTGVISVSSGQSIMNIDIGLIVENGSSEKAIFSGIVWEDLNADGILDLDEPLKDGIIVTLFDDSEMIVEQITTGTSPINGQGGYYEFETPYTGQGYLFFFDPNTANIITTPFEGNNTLIDSDVTGSNGDATTDTFTINSGSIFTGVNYGYYSTGSIGDYVWLDEDGDGLQSPTESGFNGVDVLLFDENDEFVTLTTTKMENGEDGYYQFIGLNPGIYRISIDIPDSYDITVANIGQDDEIDNDIDFATNSSMDIILNSKDEIQNIDIGLTASPFNLGDRVFIDYDGDNVFSDGDEGLNNVQVDLHSYLGGIVETTFTTSVNGVAGFYGFINVPTGDYYLQFTAPDPEYLYVLPNQGNSDLIDSDVNGTFGKGSTSLFSVTEGIQDLDIDAGLYLPSTVGNYVWSDNNKNGIQEGTEAGYGDLIVEIYQSTNEFVTSDTTDINGFYALEGLQPGDYYIRFRLDGDIQLTSKDAGMDDTLDSDASSTGLTDIFTIEYNTEQLIWDAGIEVSQGRISGGVWYDKNINGYNDFNEDGMPTVPVELLDEDMHVIDAFMTDQLGHYTFDNLSLDKYYIKVGLPAGYGFTNSPFYVDESENSDVDHTGITEIIDVVFQTVHEHIDAGLIEVNGLIDHNPSVKIFPNPSADDIQIDLINTDKEYSHLNVNIFDQSGTVVIMHTGILRGNSSDLIDISKLKSGSYQLYIEADGRVWTENIIVID